MAQATMACAQAGRIARWVGPESQLQSSGARLTAARWLHAGPDHRRRYCHRCPAAASQSVSVGTDQLKSRLLQAVSRSNNPRPGDNLLQLDEQVEALAAQLAAVNPTADTAASPLLLGSWVLLFSGKSRRLAAAAFADGPAFAGGGLRQALQAASDSAYRLFYARVPVLAGSGGGRRSAAASNVQVLREGRVDNIVESKGRLPLRLCVSGSVEVVAPAATSRPRSCVAVRFDGFTAKVGSLPSVALSLAWLSPLGYLDTCYLDHDTRISVGDKGGLFVLRRIEPAAAAPA